ncbi:metallophosphoesterase [Candidatus Woesearchaeota archaeon]|nr:metallophosphoesterase [Candidatus Woesearchaeota archaeon]
MAMIALISDIHSNLEALKAVLEDSKRWGVEKTYCLGDVVGYGANPNTCTKYLIRNRIKSIMGNHDKAVITGQGLDNFNNFAKIAARWTMDEIPEESWRYLEKMPETMEDRDMLLVHGSPRDYLNEYVYPDMPQSLFKKFFDMTKKRIIIMGHTHIPFVKKLKQGLIVNAGSVGQPRDGNKKACYCLIDPSRTKAWIKRVDYDIDKAAEKILNAHLPSFLAARLYEGR